MEIIRNQSVCLLIIYLLLICNNEAVAMVSAPTLSIVDIVQRDTLHSNMLDYNLDELVITATRTPKKLSDSPIVTRVITAKQIENKGVTDIRTLLMQEIPGLQFQEVGFGTSIDLQGLSGKHILFLIDGERMAGEIGNNIDYQRISLNDVERIEVVQGASSALYGSQAMGGVINIITKKSRDKFRVEVGMKYTQPYEKNFKKVMKNDPHRFFKKSLDKQNIDTYLSISAKWKKLQSYTNFKYKSTDGYELYDTDSVVKHFVNPDTVIYERLNTTPTGIPAYENYTISQKLNYQFSDGVEVELKGLYYHANKYDFNPDNKYEQNTNLNLFAAINYRLSSSSNLRFTLNSDRYDRNYVFELLKGEKETFYDNTLLQPRLIYTLQKNKHTIIIGGEYTQEGLYGYQFSDEDYETKRQYSSTLFAQDDWQIGEDMNLVTGLRTDYNNNYGWHVSPKVSFLYKIRPFSLRLNYAGGYRTPSLKDLYMNWDHLGMFRIFGNKDLKPESNHYFSFAGEYSRSRVYVLLSMYFNRFKDRIVGEWNNDQSELHYINQATAILSGANLSLRVNPIKDLSLYTALNYLHPTKTNGVQLTAQSKWSGNARLEYKYRYSSKHETTANIIGRYIGEKRYSVADEFEYRGEVIKGYYPVRVTPYFITDISLTHRIEDSIRITLGVNNLFDYRASIINFNSFVSPGRYGFVSLSYQFTHN